MKKNNLVKNLKNSLNFNSFSVPFGYNILLPNEYKNIFCENIVDKLNSQRGFMDSVNAKQGFERLPKYKFSYLPELDLIDYVISSDGFSPSIKIISLEGYLNSNLNSTSSSKDYFEDLVVYSLEKGNNNIENYFVKSKVPLISKSDFLKMRNKK